MIAKSVEEVVGNPVLVCDQCKGIRKHEPVYTRDNHWACVACGVERHWGGSISRCSHCSQVDRQAVRDYMKRRL